MTPKLLTEEELEALSVLVNQEIWDHFSAHIAALTERNTKMHDALWHLCNEAKGFLSMADSSIHGNTNVAVLKDRITEGFAAIDATMRGEEKG